MVIKNDPVKFIYVPAGVPMPAHPDPDAIYLVEDEQQLWVGGTLIANNVDTQDYKVKNVVFTGEGDYVQSILLDENTGVLTVVYGTLPTPQVYYKTTAEWSQDPTLVSVRGAVYCYSDHQQIDGVDVPGLKVGDGSTYVVDLPFTDQVYISHIADTSIHVSQGDRVRWDDKVTCALDPLNPELLIFSKD